MAGELNTEVLDDADSCRTTADWLKQVKSGVTHIGDVVYAQRSASEAFWRGTAGDAARQTLTFQGKDADTLEELLGQVKTALETFAGQIDTVTSRMSQARTVAREGGLIVTPTAILPPGPPPPDAGTDNLPPGPMGRQIQAHQGEPSAAQQAAIAAYEAKKRAFAEAQSTVAAARTTQQNAHEALEKAMQDPLAAAKTTKAYAMFVIGQGLNTIKGSTDAAGDLFAKASRWQDAATTIQARAERYSGRVGELFQKAAASHEKVANTASTNAAKAQKMGGPFGPRTRAAVSADASGYIQDASRVAGVSKGLVRGVPVVGTTLTIASGVTDVAMGKDPWEATEDTVASIGGGAVGGYIGGAIGTAICPGVGTVIGGLIGGFIGSWAASQGVNAATGE